MQSSSFGGTKCIRHPAKVPEETLRAPEFPSGAFHIYESIHDDGEKEVEECKEDN